MINNNMMPKDSIPIHVSHLSHTFYAIEHLNEYLKKTYWTISSSILYNGHKDEGKIKNKSKSKSHEVSGVP